MRAWILLFGTFCFHTSVSAQTARPAANQPEPLPVRKVVLYKNGMGYFEHLGKISDPRQVAEIALPSSQLNDVLKSLTVIDLGDGKVGSITYDSTAPLHRQLAELPVQIGSAESLVDLLNRIRGAEVEMRAAGAPVRGRLMNTELRRRHVGATTVRETIESTIFTPQGEVRIVEMTPQSALRLVKGELAADFERYLEPLDSAQRRDVRRLKIQTAGTGSRQLQVSYTSEAPVWKTTYRLVLDPERKPFLQGWAIVDNTTPADWLDVSLSLVAGAPISFIQNLSQPMYARRPVVPVAAGVYATPQTHEATLETAGGATAIGGVVKDMVGAAVPGALVSLSQRGEEIARVQTDGTGRYRFNVPAGTYRVEAGLPGFRPARVDNVSASTSRVTSLDLTLEPGSAADFATVEKDSLPSEAFALRMSRRSGGVPGGVVGGVAGAAMAPPPAPLGDALRQQALDAAQSERLAEQFEYKLQHPVTIRRNQSALLPIVQTEVEGEKVTLYNERDPKARLAVWLKNSSGLALDAGSFTVIDSNAFAGEGLTQTISPQESRLLSYALDPSVVISASREGEPGRLERVEISRGLMRQSRKLEEKKTYVIRNNDERARTVVVEHPVRPGWTPVQTARPAESTAAYYRFRVDAQQKTTTEFVVREEKADVTTIALSSVVSDQIALWVRQRAVDEETEKRLRTIVERKGEHHALEQKLNAQQQELETIGKEQERLRENLAKLGASKDEAVLRARYVKLLGEQEDRIAQIRAEHARLLEQRDELKKQVDALVQNLTFTRTL